MVFSSEVFLFIFLPITIALYFIAGRFKNIVLFLTSLLFYAWGEPVYIILMLVSIFSNYLFGLIIGRLQTPAIRKSVLALSCIMNLSFLGVFKYAGFAVANLNKLGLAIPDPGIALPIGISFYTFQSMSYVIDVYRRGVLPQKNVLNLGLYVSMFPQLIAGPIVRYSDVEKEIAHRNTTLEDFYEGSRRFMFGFSKKILVADVVSKIVDTAFTMDNVSANMAWLGIIAYSIQIYFDFSGYSDMAIGLGRIFGFHFLENFDYPYISKSIREFWRRWHMSLGGWFRDYVYIPLGGSRCAEPRIYLNLLIVFFLTGLWHGASWNFVVWGLWYAVFLICERFLGKRFPNIRFPLALRHLYACLVVLIGWVFFRAETCGAAFSYIRAMFSFRFDQTPALHVSLESMTMLIIGILLSMPLYRWIQNRVRHSKGILDIFAIVFFLLSILYMVGSGFSPFLYFRF